MLGGVVLRGIPLFSLWVFLRCSKDFGGRDDGGNKGMSGRGELRRGTTYIDDENVALVPVDAGLELVLPFVHLLEPLSGDDFVLLNASKLVKKLRTND